MRRITSKQRKIKRERKQAIIQILVAIPFMALLVFTQVLLGGL